MRAIAVLFLFLPTFLFAQATSTTGFEPPEFSAGDINGQNGWGHLSNSPTGGFVVPAPAGSPPLFETQSLELRTRDVTMFGVSNHLFSPLIDPPAGETGSVAGGVPAVNPQTHFTATLWYRTPTLPVASLRTDGRIAELNPSSKLAGPSEPANRYAQVRIYPDAGGLLRAEIGWYASYVSSTVNDFQVRTVAQLAPAQWYRFDYLIHLVDGTDGDAANDRFTLTIFDAAGSRIGTACGSTWEVPYRLGNFGGGPGPRAINGFDFWSYGTPNGTVVGHLDELTMTAFSPPALEAAIAGSTQVCFGGTTTLTASGIGGGAEIVSLAWRNGNGDLVGSDAALVAGAGTSTVTVTNALCETATESITVNEFAPLQVTVSGPPPLSASVTGGSGAIVSYEWRNASNDVVGTGPTLEAGPGTYTVTVTDASCGTATSPAVSIAAVVPVPAASTTMLLVMMTAIAVAALLRMRL